MATQTVAFLHIDVPFSRSSSDYPFVTRQTEFFRPVQKQFADLRSVGAMAACAFAFFHGEVSPLALFNICRHLLMAPVAQSGHRFKGMSGVFTCMRAVAAFAFLLFKRTMKVLVFHFSNHIAMAGHTELIRLLIQQVLV